MASLKRFFSLLKPFGKKKTRRNKHKKTRKHRRSRRAAMKGG